MTTAFGDRTMSQVQLRKWLMSRLDLLNDPIGQQTWGELYVCLIERVAMQLTDGLFVEAQNPQQAEVVFTNYFKRVHINGRLRPASACYCLGMKLVEESVAQFSEHYKTNQDTARGLMMMLVLSGEIEIRREKDSSYYVEQAHVHNYQLVWDWRQQYKGLKARFQK